MKLSFGKERPLLLLIVAALLLASGIFELWIGLRIVVIKPLDQGLVSLGELGGILDLLFACLLVLTAYFVVHPDRLETGSYISLILGLIFTIWFPMNDQFDLPLIFLGIIPLIAGLITLREQKPVRRQIWLRRIKGFWVDFSHNKIGLLGLVILAFYIGMAILQPILATNDPEARDLASRYAMPEWMTIFDPSLSNLPRTHSNYLEWSETSLPAGVTIDRSGDTWTIRYEGDEATTVILQTEHSYEYKPPDQFDMWWKWGATIGSAEGEATARYSLELNLTTPDGTIHPLWDHHWERYNKAPCNLRNPDYEPGDDPSTFLYPGSIAYVRDGYEVYKLYGSQIPTWITNQSTYYVYYGATASPLKRLGYVMHEYREFSEALFSPPGNFTLQMFVTINPTQQDALAEIMITDIEMDVPGLLWGVLGTEAWGRDCWSRLVYGARVSLAVGVAAAVISTMLGLVVGVAAGYLGGIVDEILMRIVDILICLPLLPLLMVLIYMWGRNILYIVLIIAIFGWQGLARITRSQVLSLREMPFVECAKASGASRFYIMFRHLVPNVLPVVLTDFILSIPGAILLEAALSFIGFGDPSTPTWGREYSFMQQIGGASTLVGRWWWAMPPGLMITILCVGFVFLGHAIDEIVNPRLRRRR